MSDGPTLSSFTVPEGATKVEMEIADKSGARVGQCTVTVPTNADKGPYTGTVKQK